ncbi:hypothetical protein RFI_05053, partial [Reticulomyxa filosa]
FVSSVKLNEWDENVRDGVKKMESGTLVAKPDKDSKKLNYLLNEEYHPRMSNKISMEEQLKNLEEKENELQKEELSKIIGKLQVNDSCRTNKNQQAIIKHNIHLNIGDRILLVEKGTGIVKYIGVTQLSRQQIGKIKTLATQTIQTAAQ